MAGYAPRERPARAHPPGHRPSAEPSSPLLSFKSASGISGRGRQFTGTPQCWDGPILGSGAADATGGRMPDSAGGRRSVGDGAGLCRIASAVRPDAESPRPDPGAAARCAADRVRPGRRARAGPVPGRAGRAQPAVGGGRRPAADLPYRRRAVAGSGHGADTRVRGAAAGRNPVRVGSRPPCWRRTGRATRADAVPAADRARALLDAAWPDRRRPDWSSSTATCCPGIR